MLAFETRNPRAHGWEAWNREDTLRTIDSPDGPIEFWHAIDAVDLPLVTYDTFSRETTTGQERRTRNRLAFRTLRQVEASLRKAGFTHLEFYGDWDRSPVRDQSAEIIAIAGASDSAPSLR